MKDSGVEWIGEIPEGWQVLKLKHLATQDGACIVDGDWVESKDISSEITSIRYLTSGNVGDGYFKEQGNGYLTQEKAAELACAIAKGGDLVFARLNYPMGRACILPAIYSQMVVAVDVVIARLNTDVSKQYMVYISMCKGYQEENALIARGTTMQRMTRTQLQNVFFPVPPVDIQAKIVAYLDTQTPEIDASIAKTQESIEEYKKLKQAVITQAVTKGIRPGRDMKDSGVEWIGDVPAEWVLMKLKYCTRIVRGGSPRPIEDYISADGKGYNWIKIGDTTKGCKYISAAKSKIIESGLPKTRLVHEGDLILTNSMSFGEPYILKINGCIHDGWVALTQLEKIDKEFLYYLLSSDICNTQFKLAVDGGVVQNLNIEKIGAARIVIPSIREQQEIAAYLDKKCAAIDTLIEKKQAIITELEAYKKSLIYEYVTGKKEVPKASC